MLTRPGFDYVRDDARRRIRVTTHHWLPLEDLTAIIDRQAGEGTWSYGMIYDLRCLRGPAPTGDAPKLVDYILAQITRLGPRGPVAFVTRSADLLGIAYRYARVSEKVGFEVEVFWDLDEAERWLDARLPPAPGGQESVVGR
jgi:hypothetical protein